MVSGRPLHALDPITIRIDKPRNLGSVRSARAFHWNWRISRLRQEVDAGAEVVHLDGEVTESGADLNRPASRVAGLVFANTWYWPAQGSLRTFSIVMSTAPLQWLILQRNAFVNFIMPRSVATPMDPRVFKTYQEAQPTPEARHGVAEFPRQIRLARPMLERLATEAPKALGDKPMELVWAMKDPAFGNEAVITRWQRDFPKAHLTRMENANHYIQEDAPEAIAAAG